MRRSFLVIAILMIAHFLLCSLSGALGWEIQLLVVSITGIITTWWAYYRFNGNYWKILIILLPFYLFYATASIYLKAYETFPIWIVGIAACFCTYLVIHLVNNNLARIPLVSIMPLLGYLLVMPNNFALVYQKSDTSVYALGESLVTTEAGELVNMNSLKGKVTLIDVWHSACAPCIKKFPELQKLHERYKEDSSVRIISLNIPLPRDKGEKPTRFTQPYSFEKLYFASKEEADKLTIEAVPLILILDQDLVCRFAGDLNVGKNIFINNAADIINRLKSEK